MKNMEKSKLRVLWFTHTRAGYDFLLEENQKRAHTGTWVESLVLRMKNDNDIDLGICFLTREKEDIVQTGNFKYYPVSNKSSEYKIGRVFNKMTLKISWDKEINKYIEVINSFKPDLIHVFGSEENFGFISNYTEIPVVLSIQGNLTVYKWKYFSGLSKLNFWSSINFKKTIKFSSAYYDYLNFKKRAKREREILKNISYIIGRTDWDKRISRILAPNSTYYYNDEILRKGFYESRSIKPNLRDKLVIATMTGPVIYKGLETVCMAVKLLNDLNVNFIWLIGGVNENENLVKSVKKKLKNNFPQKNIKFLGRLNENEIIEMLLGANIAVSPSHIENSPLTLSEAMILGLPVICSHAGGTSSRLKDKVEGLLIQSGDPWSLAGAILELKNNYHDALNYGKEARIKALKRHDPDMVVGGLKNIYRDILKTNK